MISASKMKLYHSRDLHGKKIGKRQYLYAFSDSCSDVTATEFCEDKYKIWQSYI